MLNKKKTLNSVSIQNNLLISNVNLRLALAIIYIIFIYESHYFSCFNVEVTIKMKILGFVK